MNKEQAYLKVCHFCVYQERTHRQVRQKLTELELWEDAIEEMIVKLCSENFLNEERFAKSYASGKFRQLKWGRIKIKLGLKSEGLSEYCIKKGMAEINGEDYIKTLKKLIEQKKNTIKETNIITKKLKIINFLIGKGYEKDICFDNYESL